MRQISRPAGVVTVLAIAIGGVGVGVAQAEPIEPPTFGTCSEQGTPEYSDFECTSTSGSLFYSWSPLGNRREVFFGKGKTTFYMPAGEVACTSVRALGEYVGPKEIAEIPFRFKGCVLAGHRCTTAGAAEEGEIATSALHGLLGFAQSKRSLKKPAERVTALQLAPEEEGAPFAQFDCGASEVTLRGELVPRMFVKHTGRVNTLELKLNKKERRNYIAGLEGVAPTPLEASVDGGAYATVVVKAKLTWPFSEIKINTTYSRP